MVTRNPIVMHRTREGLGGGEREEKLGPLNLNSICVHNRFSSTLPATTCRHYMRDKGRLKILISRYLND